MRIAYFNDTYSPAVNGIVVALKLLTKEMVKEHRVQLHVPAYGRTNSLEREGDVLVARYASLPIPTYREFQVAVPNYLEMASILDDFDPDVVHFHSPGVMGLGALVWAKSRNKPVVGTFHALLSEGLVYLSPRRLMPNADLMSIGRSGTGDNINKRAVWRLITPFYSRCDVVIVPSESVKREVQKHGLGRDVLVISNGIDTTLFEPKADYSPRGRVLHVGRLGYEKNVDVVLRMFAEVAVHDPQVTLTVAGDGPARHDLSDLASELGISDRVVFTGWRDRDRLADIYRDHDVFVTASAMETQGLVVLEAMLCGLPIVATDKYALPDLVHHGQNGYLAGVGEWSRMANQVITLLSDEQLRSEFGRTGRAIAEGHSITTVAPQFGEVYSRVVNNHEQNQGRSRGGEDVRAGHGGAS